MTDKPTATVHGTGSGEATKSLRDNGIRCVHCSQFIGLQQALPQYDIPEAYWFSRDTGRGCPKAPAHEPEPTPPASQPTVETLQLLLEQSQKENALLYKELTQLKARVKELMNNLSSSGT